MDALVIDTETGDLSDSPAMIEYGQATVTAETFTHWADGVCLMPPVSVQRFNPGRPMDPGAMATHGFIDDDVKLWPALSTFDYSSPHYLIGHNIDFDAKVIGDKVAKRICTLAIAKKTWPMAESHKLMALMFMLNQVRARDMWKTAHGVYTDIIGCMILVRHFIEIYELKTAEDMWLLSEDARIPEIMPIGEQWRGKPIWQVDEGMRNWCRMKPDMDPYLLKAFDKYPYRRA